jgi:DNA protecting protein dprA
MPNPQPPIDERRQAWAYLSRVFEGPSRELTNLLNNRRDPEAIARGIRRRESWLGDILARTHTRYQDDRAKADLATMATIGGRLVTPDDPEWPAEPLDAAFRFAASGKSDTLRSYQEDAVPPHALWVRGSNLRQLCAQAVSIVGSRAASNYGSHAARLISAGLIDHHWTIISGGAFGIDSAAHTEVLARGGTTIAVQACGLDRPYPRRNHDMLTTIAQHNGALVSEYPPGATPQRHRFLTRNRLIAALSSGTVIIEAAWRSGALNTLSWAAAFGKITMAVPGPITTAQSLGCHERIRNGDAAMVCSVDEVRQLLAKIGDIDVGEQYEMQFAATPVQKLSRNEMRIYDATGPRPIPTDQLAHDAGLTIGLTVHLLLSLAQQGLVERNGNAWQRAVSPDPREAHAGVG